jgi:hypothetical protein
MKFVKNSLPTSLYSYFLHFLLFVSYEWKTVCKLFFGGYFSNMMAQAHFIELGSTDVFFRLHSTLYNFFWYFLKMYVISPWLSFWKLLPLLNCCLCGEKVYYICVRKFLSYNSIYIYFYLCSVTQELLTKNRLQVMLRWPLFQYSCQRSPHTVRHFLFFQTEFTNTHTKF